MLEKIPKRHRLPLAFVSGAALLAALSPLAAKWPGTVLLLGACALAWAAGRGLKDPGKRFALACFPLAFALLFAWAAAYATQGVIQAAYNLKKSAYSAPVVWSSWLTGGPLSNPANQAGRWALYAGALLGLLAAACSGKKARLAASPHGPGRIQGLPLAQSPDKGVHRWAAPSDLAHVAEFGPPKPGKFGGGIIIGKLEEQYVRVIPEKAGLACHVSGFGASGAGKTFSLIFPNVVAGAYSGESMIIADPKGELLRGKYNKKGEYEPGLGRWLAERGYDVCVINFKNPLCSMRWNPLKECRDTDEVRLLVRAMVLSTGSDNVYFTENEIKLFTALAGLLLADFPEEQQHLRAAMSLCAWPEEALDKRFQEAYRSGKLAQVYFEAWQGAKAANLGNAVSGVTGKLQELTQGGLAWLLSGHDFSLADVAKKKTAFFCVLPVGAINLKPILTAFYYFMFKRLYELGDANRGVLPVPVRFILDEFANIGQIPGFVEVISTARSYGITIMFVLQGLKQLAQVYGGKEAENILANCDVQLLLRANDQATANFFAKRLGEGPVYAVSERKDVTAPWDRLQVAKKSEHVTKVPLLSPEQMFSMEKYQVVATIATCLPAFLKATNFGELKEYKEA
ncbi:MAG: type IV secretory system conjugative DNA transfer family protein, partial [Moorella sp. (in: Bacteria)]|nr:type IV secretory system conjugative DNA transfer family protein [Moorella sp. (in: firmicutes)]